MKSSLEYLEPAKVTMTVEVPFEEFEPAIERAAKEISQQVSIPGFRRGHVPTRVLEAQFGRGTIVQEAVNDSLDGYYADALEEQKLVPLSRPEVDVTAVPVEKGDESDLVFTVTMAVRPDVVLPDPSEYTLTVDSIAVADEDVEERLTALRERFGTLKDVDRPAGEGDHCTINLTATIDGEDVDNVEGVSYELGSSTMLDGLDEALTGKKAGESASFTSVLVGGEHAGEEADVAVTLSAVKESELPDADDDFAELASEFDTIEELRADLREQVGKDKQTNQVYAARDLLLEKLVDDVAMPLPQEVIDEEVAAHLEQEGLDADDEHGAEIREESESAIRTQLTLDVLADAFNVNVEQDELLNSMIEQAQMYGMDPNQFVQMAVQSGQLDSFAGDLRRGKAVISALRLAKVVDADGTELDVISVVGEAPEHETVPDFANQPAPRGPKAGAKAKKAQAPASSEDSSTSEDAAGDFDPNQHTVAEVKEYIAGADEAEKARVIAAEEAGKARKGILELA